MIPPPSRSALLWYPTRLRSLPSRESLWLAAHMEARSGDISPQSSRVLICIMPLHCTEFGIMVSLQCCSFSQSYFLVSQSDPHTPQPHLHSISLVPIVSTAHAQFSCPSCQRLFNSLIAEHKHRSI